MLKSEAPRGPAVAGRGSLLRRSNASGCEGWIFAEPCDLSGEALAKTEAQNAIYPCGSLLRRSKASGCEGREPRSFLAKKGKIKHRMNIIESTNRSRRVSDAAVLKSFNQLPEVKSIGNMILDPVWARKMHRSGSNELMHVIRGDVSVKMGKSRLEAGPGDTLLVPTGTLHRDEFDLSIGLEVFYIHFSWLPSTEYFQIVPPKAVTRFCAPVAAEIGKLCDRMQIGLDAGTETDRLLIGSYTHNILLLILREALRVNERKNHAEHLHHGRALLFKAQEYIDRHYAEQVSLDQIAEALAISPFYLSHLFSRESDFSFVEYITKVRMRKAKDLLADGAKNVSEAAYAVGYNDSNYFSKVFHRYFGVSPHACRCGLSDSQARKTARKYPK